MASRSSLARPMRAAVAAAKSSAQPSNAVRAFATTAGRAKELAGDAKDLPNMRHAQRGPMGKLNAPIVNPAGETLTEPLEWWSIPDCR